MKVYGKIIDIILQKEGVSASGNNYQIHTVVVEAANTNDRVVMSVFGAREYLEKYGIKVAAEGDFCYTSKADYYQGRYYQRNDLDARTGFDQRAIKTEASQQVDAMAAAAQAAQQAMPLPPIAGATTTAPVPNNDLPFM